VVIENRTTNNYEDNRGLGSGKWSMETYEVEHKKDWGKNKKLIPR